MNSKDIYTDVCYGCGACAQICPANAIEMKENKKGFLMPNIDNLKCLECGICKKVCEYNLSCQEKGTMYIGNLKDKMELKYSQSGGAFVAISDYVLAHGGVVYGSALNKCLEAIHVRAVDKKERNALRGSKYIQSRIENIFQLVENDLNNNIFVLFSGTPCQVAGLYKYCRVKGIETKNLITVDLLCHGVSSVLLWRDILDYFQKKYSGNIDEAVFRDKSDGWNDGFCSVLYMKNKRIKTSFYGGLYFNNLALRDSCYRCKYAKQERISDFTIGDAWGVKENNPELYDERGLSVLVANSQKAQKLIPYIEEYMHLELVCFEKYKGYNIWECAPHPHRSVDEFWNDYSRKSFRFIIEKYGKNNVLLNYRYILKRLSEKIKCKVR